MITRAIIQQCVSPFTYKVRIPIFDRIEEASHHTANENLLTAVASVNKGCNDQFQVGDIVFIAFENNDLGQPVIIGHLYRENILKDKLGPILNARNLIVDGNTSLSTSTKIGEIDYQKLYYLKNVTGDIQNLLDSTSTATEDVKTQIQTIKSNMLTLSNRVATVDELGSIKAGNGLSVSSDGLVSFNPVQTSGRISYLDQDTINYCRGNRFECLPQSCISSKLQYWGMLEGDTEAHWIDKVAVNYLTTNNLFNTSNNSGVDVGDDSDTTNSIYQVIIDLDLTKLPSNISIYSTINKLYLWVSTNGGSLSCQIFGSRPTKSEYHELFRETNLSGWSGSNIIPLSIVINKNSNINDGTKDHYNKLRFIFKGIKSESNRFPKLFKLAAYGSDSWSFHNNMANFDHMYSWDSDCNVTFPKKIYAGTPSSAESNDNQVVTFRDLAELGLI